MSCPQRMEPFHRQSQGFQIIRPVSLRGGDFFVTRKGKYERDEVKPSIDVALQIADYFDVSLDYLTGKVSHKVDPDIVERLTTIQSLPDSDREHILFAIDAMLRDAKPRFAYSAS